MLIVQPPPGVTILLPTDLTRKTSTYIVRHSGAYLFKASLWDTKDDDDEDDDDFKAILGYLSRSYLKNKNHLWCFRKYQRAWSSVFSVFFQPDLLAIRSLFPSSLTPSGAEMLPSSLHIDETAVLWVTAPDHERGREGHSENHPECQAEGGVAACHRSSGGGPGELWPSSWGTALWGDFECMVTAPLFELLSISRNC